MVPRNVLVLCFSLIAAGELQAQSVRPAPPTYQYYVWGTSIKDLQTRVPDLYQARLYRPGGRFPALEDALLYFDGNALNKRVVNPLAADPREITAYDSDALRLTFWFSYAKLIAVTFNMENRNILGDLRKKLGPADPISGLSVGWLFRTAAWRVSQMVVVWEEIPALATEFVTYMDSGWFALKEKQALATAQ